MLWDLERSAMLTSICCLLFNDGHVLHLRSETIAARRRILNMENGAWAEEWWCLYVRKNFVALQSTSIYPRTLRIIKLGEYIHGRLARWNEWTGSSPKFLIEIRNCVFIFYVISLQSIVYAITCEATRSDIHRTCNKEGWHSPTLRCSVWYSLFPSRPIYFLSHSKCEEQIPPMEKLHISSFLEHLFFTAIAMATTSRFKSCLLFPFTCQTGPMFLFRF